VERMSHFDEVRQMKSGSMSLSSMIGTLSASTLPDFLYDFALTPLYELDGLQALTWFGIEVEVIQRGSWNDVQRLDVELATIQTEMGKIVHPLLNITVPSLQYSLRIFFRTRAERQMAATAMAFRLYKLDHGDLPSNLAELLPDYLPDLPLDPFADGKPIGYRPDAEPPFLYSIFKDGIDQGGQYKIASGGYVARDSPDWPFFLAPHPEMERLRRAAESRETANDDPNIKKELRQGDTDQEKKKEPE